MARKIVGVTVGTPIRPQSLLEKTEHVNDTDIHVTKEDKTNWNKKISDLETELTTIKKDIGNVEILLNAI